jgi:hypothetical protein
VSRRGEGKFFPRNGEKMLLILGLGKMRGKNKPEKKGRMITRYGLVFPGTGKSCFLIAHWGKSGEKITPEKQKMSKINKKKVAERQKKNKPRAVFILHIKMIIFLNYIIKNKSKNIVWK